jgi:predicted anti-sigma-YlaC factor YlaD
MPKRLLAVCCLLAAASGCSIKRVAINKFASALASGGSTYQEDDDPDLVGAALPFGLKLMESLLAEVPKNPDLLMAVSSGFTQYSYAFVEQPAALADESLDRRDAVRARARKLYQRAHDYGMRGLDARYPGFAAKADQDIAAVLARTRKRDVPLLYWTAASLGLAISSSKGDPEMVGRLPIVEALIGRVVELDEGWSGGAVPEFLISLESSRPGLSKAEMLKAMKQHFDRAIELSKGARAGGYVSYAENACVAAQDAAGFRSAIAKALAVDTETKNENRLANLISQRRARWLLAHVDDLFLEAAPAAQ